LDRVGARPTDRPQITEQFAKWIKLTFGWGTSGVSAEARPRVVGAMAGSCPATIARCRLIIGRSEIAGRSRCPTSPLSGIASLAAAATGRVIRARVLVRGWRVVVELNP
jgi:hypothetical protein